MQENIWRQFDHKLLKLKLDEIRTNFDKAESEGLDAPLIPQISPELDLADLAADPRLGMQVGAELREIMTARVEAELGIVYGTYRYVWKVQQKKETPDFLRVVLRKGLLPRLSQMKEKLSDTNFRQLKEKWQTLVEIEARELEHREFAHQKVSDQAEVKPNQSGARPVVKAGFNKQQGFEDLPEKQQDYSDLFDRAGLTSTQKNCASLRWEYGLPIKEIARRFGKNRKSIQEGLARAKMRMERASNKERAAKNLAKSKPGGLES